MADVFFISVHVLLKQMLSLLCLAWPHQLQLTENCSPKNVSEHGKQRSLPLCCVGTRENKNKTNQLTNQKHKQNKQTNKNSDTQQKFNFLL